MLKAAALHYGLTFLLSGIIAFAYLLLANSTTLVSPLATKADAQVPIPTATPLPTDTPTPTPSPLPTATPTPIPPTATPTPQIVTSSDLETLFGKYSSQYATDVNELKKIANCETGFNTNADNGINVGLFQYGPASWQSIRGQMGLDGNLDLRKNAEEAIKTAAYQISRFGTDAWPSCK